MKKVSLFITIFVMPIAGMDNPRQLATVPEANRPALYLGELSADLRTDLLPLYMAGAQSNVRDNRGDDVAEQVNSLQTYKTLLKDYYELSVSSRDAAYIDTIVKQLSSKPPSKKATCLPNRVCLTAHMNPQLLRKEFNNKETRAARIAEFSQLSQQEKDASAVQVMRFCPSRTVISGLLEGGASVNAQDKESRYSLLRLAVEAPISPVHKKRLLRTLVSRPELNPDDADKYGLTPLLIAVSLDDEEAVDLLLEANADVTVMDRLYNTPLGVCAHRGSISIVRKLLAKSANIYGCNPYHATNNVLAQAVQCRDARAAIPLLKTIIEARAHQNDINNIKAFNHFITIAIIQAALLGRADCVEFLMRMPGITFDKLEQAERKLSPFNPDLPIVNKTHSALTGSIARGFYDIAIFLLENSSPAKHSIALSAEMRARALGTAVQMRSKIDATDAHKCAQLDRIIELILQSETLPIADTLCLPACYQAAACNNQILLKKLLDHGAKKDPEIASKTLLHASKVGNPQAISALLEHVSPNVVDMNGVPPLHHATIVADSKSIHSIGVLLSHDANVFKTDKWGNTVFHKLCLNSDAQIRLILLDIFKEQTCSSVLLAALVNASNFETGDTPLLKAAALDNGTETVKKLIEMGANVNQANKKGDTPLHSACEHFQVETVRVLLKAGAKPQVKNRSGCGPLTKAAGASINKDEEIKGAKEIMRLLREAGAPLEDFQNGMVRNAARHGNTELVQSLIDLGADPTEGSSSFKNNALHKAAQKGYSDTVEVLINHINIHTQNAHGLTPRELACAHDAPYSAVESFLFAKRT